MRTRPARDRDIFSSPRNHPSSIIRAGLEVGRRGYRKQADAYATTTTPSQPVPPTRCRDAGRECERVSDDRLLGPRPAPPSGRAHFMKMQSARPAVRSASRGIVSAGPSPGCSRSAVALRHRRQLRQRCDGLPAPAGRSAESHSSEGQGSGGLRRSRRRRHARPREAAGI